MEPTVPLFEHTLLGRRVLKKRVSVEDPVEVLRELFPLRLPHLAAGVGLGMLLATLRLGSQEKFLEETFQPQQTVHDPNSAPSPLKPRSKRPRLQNIRLLHSTPTPRRITSF